MEIRTMNYGELTPTILDKFASFLATGLKPNDTNVWKKRFDFWWKANPNLKNEDPVCWYIYDKENDSIEGFIGRIPLMYQYGDQQLKAVSATSWYVTEKMRGINSTRLFMKYCHEKDAELFLDTTPSIPVQKMLPDIGFMKIGGETVPQHTIISSLKIFISVLSNLIYQLSESETGVKKNILRIASKLGNIASTITHKSKQKKNPSTTSSTHELRICTNTASFTEHLYMHKTGTTIEISKDKTSLDWILFSKEVLNLLKRRVILIFTKTGEYCGYLIYDIKYIECHPYIRITELQLLRPEDAIIKLVVKYLKAEAKRNECYSIVSTHIHASGYNDKLFCKYSHINRYVSNNYYVKIRKDIVDEGELHSIYVPSALDPDVGFI